VWRAAIDEGRMGKQPVLVALQRAIEISEGLVRNSTKSLVAILLSSASSIAFTSPTRADTGGATIETVVVTAEKRSEDVQAVPLAVTALSADDLKASRIDDATALQQAVPNLFFTRAGFGTNNYSIRGVGSQTTAATADSGITVHENNVPITVDRAADVDFFDVDRVEVLRGPQGTQFGRNATGGVINIITRQPTRDLDGQLGFEYVLRRISTGQSTSALAASISICTGSTISSR
jgi:outer membrane receptor protein involved in Fe transport